VNNRIPEYFQLERYGITARDVVLGTLQCEPDLIQPRVIVMPGWQPELFADAADAITEIVPGKVYELQYQAQRFSLIRSGIGAPQTGAVMLALGGTACQTAVFIGSVGGLKSGVQIGDLILADQAISGDGFSRYLDAKLVPDDCFLQTAEPDRGVTDALGRNMRAACHDKSTPVHHGVVFSTDSLVAQFARLPYIADELHCLGIEMETAAVFRAARLVGIRVGALLQVSDLPLANKSIYAGRTELELKTRRTIRREVLSRIVLATLLGLA